MILSGIINIVLGVLGIVAFLWIMFGGLAGVIWIIVYLAGDKEQKLNVKKWIFVTFGGMILLPIVFTFYAIFFLVKTAVSPNTSFVVTDPPIIATPPVSVDAKKFGEVCKVDKMCGEVTGINCNQEVDGPYYYVNTKTSEVLATCGGACMGGGKDCLTKCVEYGNLCK